MTNKVSYYSSIADILPMYDYFIIDVWGVLHDGESPYPDAIHALTRLKQAGKKIFLLSNSSSRLVQLREDMTAMGIPPHLYDGAMTAGELTHQLLKQQAEPWVQSLGTHFYYIGPTDRVAILEGLPYRRTLQHTLADFLIVTGLFEPEHTQAEYAEILQACAQRSVPMICANPDLKIVRKNGAQRACAGAIAKQYAERGGMVYYIGKPYLPIYQTCLQQLGYPDKERIVAIGDSLSTDIQGAINHQLSSILILGGVLKGEISRESELLHLFEELVLWPRAWMKKLVWA